MIIKLALIICVIFALNGAEASSFREEITVGGAGQLVCRTDTELGQDWVDASGPQTYSRNVKWDIEKETASLKSNYSININSANHNSSDDDNNNSDGNVNNLDNINININNSDNISVNINNSDGFYINSYNKSKQNSSLNSTTSAGRDPPETASPKANPFVSNQKSDLPDDNSRHDSVGQRDTNSNDLPDYYKYSTFKVTNRSNQQKELPSDGGSPSRNHYGIRMTYPGQLEHEVEVSGADSFTANNSISFDGGSVSTNYVMKGKGDLKGSVIESGPMGRPHQMTKTEIIGGDFTIGSGVDDEAQIGEESDFDRLSKEVEKPKVGDEEKQNESNKVKYYGLLENYSANTATGEVILIKTVPTGEYAEQKEQYWFIWEDIEDENVLLDLKTGLAKNLSYTWATTSSVKKTDNTILVIGDGKSITLTFDGNEVKLSDGSQVLDEFIVQIENKKHKILIPKKYDKYNPNDNSASASAASSSQQSQSKQIDINRSSSLIDPIIPALIFGSHVNSTYVNRITTVSEWGTIHIGRYKPMQDKNFGKVTQDYSVNLTDGIFTFENVSAEGPKQNYLNIRYEGSRIKIHNTPAGTRFEIYKGRI